MAVLRPGGAAHAIFEATRRGQVVLRRDRRFNGVKVFSATMQAQRDLVGETAIAWIDQHPEIELVDITVTQSSDAGFEYVAIVITFWQA